MNNPVSRPMSALSAAFGTDKQLEQNGVELQYGNVVILAGRAGGANARYSKSLERHTKPVRRMIQTETLPPEQLEQIFRTVYAESVVFGWWTVIGYDGKGAEVREPWIEHPMADNTGKEELVKLPFNQANFEIVMRDLPDLFDDLRQQTTKPSLFKRDNLDAAVGN
jgi:hypothetical protein